MFTDVLYVSVIDTRIEEIGLLKIFNFIIGLHTCICF